MKIITENIFPPIPVRSFDWSAVTDDYEPGCPIGYGRTEEDAIAELRQQIEEKILDAYADPHPSGRGPVKIEDAIGDLVALGYSSSDAHWTLCAVREDWQKQNGQFGVGT